MWVWVIWAFVVGFLIGVVLGDWSRAKIDKDVALALKDEDCQRGEVRIYSARPLRIHLRVIDGSGR